MDYLTVNEAAEALQLSVPTIKRYIYEGKLKSSKLPGGQHRIPQSEIDALLSPTGEATASEPASASLEDRVVVIERWLTELQEEVERIAAVLQVLSTYSYQGAEEMAEQGPGAPGEVLVLGPGCKKCGTLHDLTVKVLQETGRGQVPVRPIKDLHDIATFGPVVTPALVIGGKVVLSGRVPTAAALKNLLDRHLTS